MNCRNIIYVIDTTFSAFAFFFFTYFFDVVFLDSSAFVAATFFSVWQTSRFANQIDDFATSQLIWAQIQTMFHEQNDVVFVEMTHKHRRWCVVYAEYFRVRSVFSRFFYVHSFIESTEIVVRKVVLFDVENFESKFIEFVIHEYIDSYFQIDINQRWFDDVFEIFETWNIHLCFRYFLFDSRRTSSWIRTRRHDWDLKERNWLMFVWLSWKNVFEIDAESECAADLNLKLLNLNLFAEFEFEFEFEFEVLLNYFLVWLNLAFWLS